ADFVGAVNLVPSIVRDVRDGVAIVSLGPTDAPVPVPEGLSPASGAQVLLCIRPESLALRPASAAADGQVVVPGTVARRAFLGDLMRYWVTVDGREWIVDQPDPGAVAHFDGAVQVAIRPERIHVIAEGDA
ncbi:MAG TPA: TOBE domain-containing protein, partial [Candidatus Limnocylindria bacterium]|nr:TOBE domain-containing protein [Candidatus Limnocylindria bacterium]